MSKHFLIALLLGFAGCSRSTNETKNWIMKGHPSDSRHVYFYAPHTSYLEPEFLSRLDQQCGGHSTAQEKRRCRSLEFQHRFETSIFEKMKWILNSNSKALVFKNIYWHWAVEGFSITINPAAGREILRKWPEVQFADVRDETDFVPMSTTEGPSRPLDLCRLDVDTAEHPCKDLGCLKAQSEFNLFGQGARIAVIDNGYSNQRFHSPETRTVAGLTDIETLGEDDRFQQLFFHRLRNAQGKLEHRNHGEVVSALIGSSDGGAAPSAEVVLLPTPPGGDPYYEDKVFRAMTNAFAINADVVNLSLGWTAPSEVGLQLWKRLLQTAKTLDIAVVASAGNEGASGVRYPANFSSTEFPNLLSVGSIKFENAQLSWLPFSSYNANHPILVAPGCNVKVALWSGKMFAFKGTSASAPIVSGLLAQLRGGFLNRSTIDIIGALKSSGGNFPNRRDQVGLGAPDVVKAYETLKKTP